MKQRLQKILSTAGITSRRKAEEMLLQGRIAVNGTIVRKPGSLADTALDLIEVDGVPIGRSENKVYIMLHKPAGYITSVSDPEGRPTVMQLIEKIPERIFPVGRLDYDTEGLLVLTNDGDFAHILQHPRHDIQRTYRVKVHGLPAHAQLEKLRQGVVIDGTKMSCHRIKPIEHTPKNTWLELVLYEGRNRQIKKMFEGIGHRVTRIMRTAFGPLLLDTLPPGAYRFMTKQEIRAVKNIGARSPGGSKAQT
jgi:pseudouridine synthase